MPPERMERIIRELSCVPGRRDAVYRERSAIARPSLRRDRRATQVSQWFCPNAPNTYCSNYSMTL
jgi:hypothetical protein